MDNVLIISQWLLAASFTLIVGYAVVSDFRTLHIPNWTPVTIFILFLPAALAKGIGLQTIAVHYGVGIGLFAFGAALFASHLIGGGDVKLLAATGVWVGWDGLTVYFVYMALIGGALALAVILLKRLSLYLPLLPDAPWSGSDGEKQQNIPYGVAIGLAAVILFPRSPVFPADLAAYLNL
ncbi:MAG: prepilin peptidase [Rhodospirillales bacterium]